MRRKALESDIIIVNHHLFFADLAIKLQAGASADAGILPAAAAVIFDEAHELEEIASNYFGIGLSTQRFDELARDVETMLRAKQRLHLRHRKRHRHPARPRPHLLRRAPRRSERHDAGLGRMPFEQRAEFLEESGDTYTGASTRSRRLEGELERLKDVEEAPGLRKRAADIRNPPQVPARIARPQHRLLDRAPRRRRRPQPAPAAHRPRQPSHPSAGHAHRRLRTPRRRALRRTTAPSSSPPPPSPSPQRTSTATLRLRAHLASASASPSPANSSCPRTSTTPSKRCSTCRPTCPTRASPTSSRRPPNASAASSRSPAAAPSASSPATRRCAPCTSACSPSCPTRCCCRAPPRATSCSKQFRDTPNAVLFGTSSFWQGVDVQGEQLSCVIIDRLPFAVPSDPVVKARMDAIDRRRRQRLLRLPGPQRRHHAQAGLRPPDPLAQRPRRPHAARPPHPAPALRPHLPRLACPPTASPRTSKTSKPSSQKAPLTTPQSPLLPAPSPLHRTVILSEGVADAAVEGPAVRPDLPTTPQSFSRKSGTLNLATNLSS